MMRLKTVFSGLLIVVAVGLFCANAWAQSPEIQGTRY